MRCEKEEAGLFGLCFLFLLLLDARVGRVYDTFRNDSYFVFGICKEVP